MPRATAMFAHLPCGVLSHQLKCTGLALAFAVAAAPAQTPDAQAETPLEKLVRVTGPRVAAVRVYSKSGVELGQGSAFLAPSKGTDDYCVVSNRHVLRGAHSATVTFPGLEPIQVAGVVAEDSQHDLVVVNLQEAAGQLQPLPLAASFPRPGQDIAAIGNPAGLSNSVSSGIVAAVRELDSHGSVFQITAPISPGSSGSPVLAMNGEVVGVATFQLRGGQNLNFAIPIQWVRALEYRKSLPLPSWGGDLAAVPKLQSSSGNVPSTAFPDAAKAPSWWLHEVIKLARHNKDNGVGLALEAAEQWIALGDDDASREAIATSVDIASEHFSRSFRLQIQFLVRLDDYVSADILATRSLEGRAHRDIAVYTSMLATACQYQTLKPTDREEIAANAARLLNQVPRPQYHKGLKEFEPAPYDRCQALAEYTEAMVCMGRDKDALAACSEAMAYKSESNFLHDEPTRRYYDATARLRLRSGDHSGALEAWRHLDLHAYSGEAIKSPSHTGGWEHHWRTKADALRTQIAKAALEAGDTRAFDDYRIWLASRTDKSQGVGACTKAAEVLQMSGDASAAMRLAKGDKSALIAPLVRLAATGELKEASRLLPLLPEDQRLAGRALLMEHAWLSQDSAIFAKMQEALDAELTSYGGPGLLWSPWSEDRFPHIKRWALIKARANDLEDTYAWWCALSNPTTRAVVALAVAQHLATSGG